MVAKNSLFSAFSFVSFVSVVPLWLISCFLVSVLPVAGCQAPLVERSAEQERFGNYLKDEAAGLKIDPSKPLSMAQCENLAIAHSLDLSVKNLTLRLQDDKVALSLVSGLPSGSFIYDDRYRSNSNTGELFGQTFVEDTRNPRASSARGVVPVLDFGLTYYSYRMAVDAKHQEQLLLTRAEQLLRRDIRVAYARHAGAIRQQRLAQVAYQAAQQVLRTARNLEREQMAAAADTALVESAVAQAGLQLSQTANDVHQTKLILLQLMSLPPEVQFSIVSDLPPLPPAPAPKDLAAWEDRALKVRPELSVQDLARQISASNIKAQASNFFPHLNLTGSFDWSNGLGLANPAFFLGGFEVTHSLLQGGAVIWQYDLAKKDADVQRQNTLLVSLGVLYEVDFLALRVSLDSQTVQASGVLDKSRRAALDRILSLYREGLEDEAGAARSLADLTTQATILDQSQTEYLSAWYELEAAVLPETSLLPAASTQPASTQPSSTQPSSAPARNLLPSLPLGIEGVTP
jgi:outer membrane protein TolC